MQYDTQLSKDSRVDYEFVTDAGPINSGGYLAIHPVWNLPDSPWMPCRIE
jgi:hypothetical protein